MDRSDNGTWATAVSGFVFLVTGFCGPTVATPVVRVAPHHEADANSTVVPSAAMKVEGEIRTIDESGEPRLWGRGRPGTAVYDGLPFSECQSGNLQYGLSLAIVGWGSAADACPAGTWVCDRSKLVACDTDRPDTETDGRSCDGTEINMTADRHYGWTVGYHNDVTATNFGNAFFEDGTNDTAIVTCWMLPVWCCWN